MPQISAPSYRPLEAKQVMNRVQCPEMPFQYSLNPYRGCAHGCSFCYARSTHSFFGLEVDDSFRTSVFVKENAPEALERQLWKMAKRVRHDLSKLAEQIGLLAIGTATDPYQPIEAKSQVTRECLKILARYQVPVTITTRSPLILRDLDILTTMRLKAVNISLSTLDNEVWKGLEPSSPSPAKRLSALADLRASDVYAGVFIAPIIPGMTDSAKTLDEVLQAAKKADASFAWPSILRLTPDVKTWFLNSVEQVFPDKAERLRSIYFGARTMPGEAYSTRIKNLTKALMVKNGFSVDERRMQRQDQHDTPSSVQLALPLF